MCGDTIEYASIPCVAAVAGHQLARRKLLSSHVILQFLKVLKQLSVSVRTIIRADGSGEYRRSQRPVS